jgi:HEAT repeat protein
LRLSREEDPFVVLHAVAALGRLDTPQARAALADVIAPGKSPKESAPDKAVTDYGLVRIRAIEALGRSGDVSYLGLIEPYTDDPNEYVQLAAMVAIAQLGKSEAVPQLQRFFFSADRVTRKNAAYALRHSTVPNAVEILIDAITDKDSTVRERVITSLKELTGPSFGGNAPDGRSPEKIQNEWRSWWRAHKDKFTVPAFQFLCHMK